MDLYCIFVLQEEGNCTIKAVACIKKRRSGLHTEDDEICTPYQRTKHLIFA